MTDIQFLGLMPNQSDAALSDYMSRTPRAAIAPCPPGADLIAGPSAELPVNLIIYI